MAQKHGGILRDWLTNSPASMSIHEEGTISVVLPMMGVFNNLVMFDQHKRQNSLDDIVPDLAEKWTWSEDGKKLTFALRSGVSWHDGNPCLVLDYPSDTPIFGNTRDEIREVAPGLFLARLYETCPRPHFRGYFAIEVQSCCHK